MLECHSKVSQPHRRYRSVWGAIAAALLAIVLLQSPVAALAAVPSEEKSAEPTTPADPYGRTTPRNQQIGLFQALSEKDFQRVAQYLEVPDQKSEAAAQKAEAFKEVLDARGTLLPRIGVSMHEEGALDDGLPPDEDKIGEFTEDGTIVPVVIRRVESEDGLKIWLVSKETLARIPDAPSEPQVAPDKEGAVAEGEPGDELLLFGAPLKSWLLLATVGMAIFVAIILFFRWFSKVLDLEDKGKGAHALILLFHAAVPPGALLAVYAAISHFAEPLGAGVVERTAISGVSGMVAWLAITWLVWRLTGIFRRLAARRFHDAGLDSRIGISNFIARIFRLMVLVVAGAVFLSTFGIDVTAGLAALGIGGLALALGAKTAVEDLVGSISILADKPVRIGDDCRFNGITGTIVDIGMRSTKIRTRDRTLLAVPNSQFAVSQIENLSLRDHFHVDQMFGVSFTAGAAGVERVLQIAREVVESDSSYVPKTCPVRFRGFGPSSYQFQLYFHLESPSYGEGFLQQERLLLALLKRFEAEGIAIALPAQELKLNSKEG